MTEDDSNRFSQKGYSQFFLIIPLMNRVRLDFFGIGDFTMEKSYSSRLEVDIDLGFDLCLGWIVWHRAYKPIMCPYG